MNHGRGERRKLGAGRGRERGIYKRKSESWEERDRERGRKWGFNYGWVSLVVGLELCDSRGHSVLLGRV